MKIRRDKYLYTEKYNLTIPATIPHQNKKNPTGSRYGGKNQITTISASGGSPGGFHFSVLKTAGFTLVELLIAVTLFSVIALSLYSAFHTGVLSYKKINLSSDHLKEVQLFFNAFELDLKNAFVYASDDSGFAGDGQGCRFFTFLDSYDNQAHRVGDICFVDYKIDGSALKASFCKGLSALQKGECRQETILSFYQGEIIFHYAFALSEDAQAYLWQDAWPSASEDGKQAKTLPLAVKVELNFSGEDKRAGSLAIEKIIVLPLRVCEVKA